MGVSAWEARGSEELKRRRGVVRPRSSVRWAVLAAQYSSQRLVCRREQTKRPDMVGWFVDNGTASRKASSADVSSADSLSVHLCIHCANPSNPRIISVAHTCNTGRVETRQLEAPTIACVHRIYPTNLIVLIPRGY